MTIDITGEVVTGATKLTDSEGNIISMGNASTPVYFSGGVPAQANTIPTITLNNTRTTSPNFYAPLTGGTSGYFLKSNGSTAPSWVELTKATIGLGNVDNTADAAKNVLTATKFNSSRTISLNGDVTGSASGDGSSGWAITTTVQNNSHIHDTTTIQEQTPYGGSWNVFAMPRVSTLRANRFSFLPADQIIIEQTTDGGETWVDAGYTDAQKAALFLGNATNAIIRIPLLNGVRSKLCGIRITITGMKYNVPDETSETQKYNYWNSNYVQSNERYCSLTGLYLWVSSSSDRISLLVQASTGVAPNNWITTADCTGATNLLSGWSGGNVINGLGNRTFGGGVTQTSNYWNWRMTFFTEGVNGGDLSPSSNTNSQYVYRVCGYGPSGWSTPNNLMAIDHLYNWDANQNVIFPAKITATEFNGVASKSNAANVTSTANAVAYYTNTAGTFGSKASANGALYATSANGALQFGTLPVGQGGTGATTLASGKALIGNGTGAIQTRDITNTTAVSAITANTNLITANTLAYWNGAYSGTSSRLAYCSLGAFGAAAIRGVDTTPTSGSNNLITSAAVSGALGDYVTLGTSQTITAAKLFSSATASTNKSTGAVRVAGGVGIGGRMSAGEVMVGDHVTVTYNSSSQSLDFTFV